MRNARDIEPSRFPQLSWQEDALAESLQAVYNWVENEGIRSANWYLTEKRSKARWSRWLRVTGTVLATAGAAVPFLAVGTDGTILQWGYFLLVLAAGTLALDRFFGFSSAWMRYLRAEQAIHDTLQQFQFQYASMLTSLAGRIPTADQAIEQLDAMAVVAATINEAIRTETLAWVEEFHSNVNELRTLVTTTRRADGQVLPDSLPPVPETSPNDGLVGR
jgi:hypothetical protein